MDVAITIKLPKIKDNTYTLNIDLDPSSVLNSDLNATGGVKVVKVNTELGGIQRPSADRLKILKHPDLKEEEEATEKVMDSLEL